MRKQIEILKNESKLQLAFSGYFFIFIHPACIENDFVVHFYYACIRSFKKIETPKQRRLSASDVSGNDDVHGGKVISVCKDSAFLNSRLLFLYFS